MNRGRLLVVVLAVLMGTLWLWRANDGGNATDKNDWEGDRGGLAKPVMGTRIDKHGELTPRDSIEGKDALYLGCDLPYADVEPETKARVVWNYYHPNDLDDPRRKLHAVEFALSESGKKRVYIDDHTWNWPVGEYECRWRILGFDGWHYTERAARIRVH